MKRVFISTTNSVDNGRVVKYYGVVSSHIVAGAGFFSDFSAGLTDFFGGRSGSYMRQLESLYNQALGELSDKASILGANCILGLRVDLNNIPGKGMSMFMITAVGTAAKIDFETDVQSDSLADSVTNTVLANEIAKREILHILNDKETDLPLYYWDTILRSPDNDYVIPLSRKFFSVYVASESYPSEYFVSFRDNYNLFIQMVDRKIVLKGVYEGMYLEGGYIAAQALVKKYSLFDAMSLLNLIKEGYVKRAIALLGVDQPTYTEEDLHDMETLSEAFNHLPDVGKKEFVKGGMFSKDGEKYICAHGHKNDTDIEFCTECGENIKGLERDDLREIESFRNRIAVLKDLLTEVQD